MIFSSALFLFYFFPVFLVAYFLTPVAHKNKTALLGSALFYFWGAPWFGFVLVGAIVADFLLVKQLVAAENATAKQRLLTLAVGLNVGLLAYFKYANFFIDNVNALLQSLAIEAVAWTAVVLPIGISFFTFQKLSYIIDVYYGKAKPLDQLADYALYIMLFPQLIAGPIVRFNEIATQLKDRTAALNIDNKLNGIFRFSVGLAKKLLIANPLGEQVDLVFASTALEIGSLDAWTIITAYAFQIYFDFSGYSDMAIGIGLLLGFRFPENFNFPYIARSITEFWRRWHITLSNWMKDYLYIPLGGNRGSRSATYVNLTIVFLFSGLWHGAAWTFVLWGLFHGCFLILDRLFLKSVLNRIGQLPALVFTFIITLLGWVLFRSESLAFGWDYYALLFSGEVSSTTFSIHFWTVFTIAAIISFVPGILPIEEHLNRLLNMVDIGGFIWKFFVTLVLLILCMSEIEVSSFNPFIYFRF
ncbi:MAG: MBOAT family O-acyltransferase [Bacteroidota bacterium]